MTDIASITLWHRRARPHPTEIDADIQIGVHLEEVCEMLDAMEGADPQTRNRIAVARQALAMLADGLKSKSYEVEIIDRVALLDALCDQVVTSVGVAHCLHMQFDKGLDIVTSSNWSKFDEQGQPIFDANGKIKKGPRYTPPHLDECV